MTVPTYEEAHADDGPGGLESWFKKVSKTIAIDFDGVLHPYTAGWCGSEPADEPPVDGAISFLDKLYNAGYRIVVFSTRANHVEGFNGISNWLHKWHLDDYIADVTSQKPAAIAYVDDRGVTFSGNWEIVWDGIERLENFHPASTPVDRSWKE